MSIYGLQRRLYMGAVLIWTKLLRRVDAQHHQSLQEKSKTVVLRPCYELQLKLSSILNVVIELWSSEAGFANKLELSAGDFGDFQVIFPMGLDTRTRGLDQSILTTLSWSRLFPC
jgi:hypothetical protein